VTRGDARVVSVIPLVQTRSLARALDYQTPAPLVVGAVVQAPLGPRTVRGVVTELPDSSTLDTLRSVTDTGQRIPPDLVTLALSVADRYATTPARVLDLVMPPTINARETAWLRPAPDAKPRSARQASVLAALAAGPLPRSSLDASPDTLRRMIRAGLVIVEPPATSPATSDPLVELTGSQQAAVRRIVDAVDARCADPVLLYGVTGSGKTEVFMRAVARCLALGRQAIVLVPEIALAPQTASRLAERFGGRVAVLHSQQAASDRASEYQRIARGDATIIVGPRSAVFAPIRDLGLVVIDEEHDTAYKQESDPRYDARSVAVLRARHHHAAVVVASATPRPETWQTLERVELPDRIGGRLPPVDIVDLRRDGNYPLSRPLRDALATIERHGGRAILLLNRRGEAPALHCRGCGRLFACPDCDVAMTLHRQHAGLHCHHCGRAEPLPRRCGACGAVDLARIGAGTERLEDAVRDAHPRLVVLRLDADSTARRGALEATLAQFAATDRAVLCGTQLVAKGHHFDDVRLAAVIDADTGLAQPDFRAEERTFALLVQLAGRAGREGFGGRVMIQAWDPDHRVVRLAARHGVPDFLNGELARREALGYPPFRRLIRLLVSAPDATRAEQAIGPLASDARQALDGDILLGPAPLHRIRGRARSHLLVKTPRARRAARILGALAASHAATLRRLDATVVVDVDPQTL
jgi:primosomal protein N' (replication factor Y) (superfamily II helicase)